MALVSQDGTLYIYRLNGQRVWCFNVKNSQNKDPDIYWSPDGKRVILTVGDHCRFYDIILGKFVVDEESKDRVVDIGWLMDLHGLAANTRLFSVDVASSLPKLAPLATGNNIVTSKQELDLVMQIDGDLKELHLMVYSDSIEFVMNGLFNVGPICFESLGFFKIVPSSCLTEYYVLNRTNDAVCLLKLDLNSLNGSSKHLVEVISCSSKISVIMMYFQELVSSLHGDPTSFKDLNERLVSSIEHDNSPDGAVSELSELLVTGMMSEKLASWLDTTVGDKNLKRWLKLGNNCIDLIKHKIFSLLIPAAERLMVLVSELRSLAEWKAQLGVYELVQQMAELATVLLRQVYDFVLRLNHEQKNFNCFINWLTVALAELKDEKKDEETNYSVTEVSEYITGHLCTLQVYDYIGRGNEERTLKHSFNLLNAKCIEVTDKVKKVVAGEIKIGRPLLLGPLGTQVEPKFRLVNQNLVVVSLAGQEIQVRQVKKNGEIIVITLQLEENLQNLDIKQLEFYKDQLLILAKQPGTAVGKYNAALFSVSIGEKQAIAGHIHTITADHRAFQFNSHEENAIYINPELIAANENAGMIMILADDRQRYVVLNL